MKKLLLIAALLLEVSAISSSQSQARMHGCLMADILFVTDWSGSMQAKQNLVFEAFNEFANGLELSDEGIRLGFISFADTASFDLSFTANPTDLLVMENKLVLRKQSGGTNVTLPLVLARSVFQHLPENRYYDAKKVIVYISDGQWWPDDNVKDSVDAIKEAAKLRDMGVYVYTIDPWTTDSHPAILKKIATDSSFYIQTDYEGLAETLRRLNFCM